MPLYSIYIFLVYLQYFAAQGQWISTLSGPRGGTICTTSMGKNCSYLKYKNWKWCVYPALLLQTITDASRRRKYSPQHLSPGPEMYNIDPVLSGSWNVPDFLLPPHTASLTAHLRITNLLEENYNIGSAVACSWKHCHCHPKGPYYRDWVHIGTFLAFWVPIGSLFIFQGPYFQCFGSIHAKNVNSVCNCIYTAMS